MSFWTTQLGGGAAAPAPAQPQAPAYQGGYRPSPFFQPTSLPPAQPPQVAQQMQQQAQQNDGTWGTVEGSLKKAVSAKLTETCPECGSGDYFRPAGQPNAMQQCYTCGYNGRFAHSTAGGGMPSDTTGPTQPSRQTAVGGKGGHSNFRPQQIIGRIGD